MNIELRTRINNLIKKDAGLPSFYFFVENESNPIKYLEDLLHDEFRESELAQLLDAMELKQVEIEDVKKADASICARRKNYPTYAEFIESLAKKENGDSSDYNLLLNEVYASMSS